MAQASPLDDSPLPMQRRTHKQRGNSPPHAGEQGTGTRISTSSVTQPTRRAPRQVRAQRTVEAILEAAGQLLVTRGRGSVTTNAVAARAGVSVGSLYQYFPNKEAIFTALQQEHRHRVMPLIHQALQSLSDLELDIVDGMVNLMRALLEINREDPGQMRVLVEELEERASEIDFDSCVSTLSTALAERTGRSPHNLHATAWLASMILTHIGRALVHRPPELDAELVFVELEILLRALFASIERPA